MAITPADPAAVPVESPVTAPEIIPVLPALPTEHPSEAPLLAPTQYVPGKALYKQILPGIIQAPLDLLLGASRKSSLWPMTFGLACCAIEMIATYMAHYDLDRFGIVPWPSPRQSDVMIVAGTVTKKMAPSVKLLYEQMPGPKWVISMGACASTGGVFDTYSVIQGVDKFIPVDVYVPGCPPRPEGVVEGLILLQELVDKEKFSDYSTSQKK